MAKAGSTHYSKRAMLPLFILQSICDIIQRQSKEVNNDTYSEDSGNYTAGTDFDEEIKYPLNDHFDRGDDEIIYEHNNPVVVDLTVLIIHQYILIVKFKFL